jgi:hypothetical protein
LRTGKAGEFLPYGLFFHVADANQLYYEGVRVKLTASGDGVVEPAETETDAFGFVSASWKLATEPGLNQLRVEIVGSEGPPLIMDAVGVRNPPRLRDPFPFIFGPSKDAIRVPVISAMLRLPDQPLLSESLPDGVLSHGAPSVCQRQDRLQGLSSDRLYSRRFA